jgi:hypothetical protein
MSAIDFKEIPKANLASGEQDKWELFAEGFLKQAGFNILSGPNRGADGGRDILALETRTGVGGETRVKWLVSCKHNAHSGESVTLEQEKDILDRVKSNGCKGFLAVYSTLPSSGLLKKLEGLQGEIEWFIYDSESIEATLLKNPDGILLAERYFPVSVRKWKDAYTGARDVAYEAEGIFCEYCHRDLGNARDGIIVLWERRPKGDSEITEYVDFYVSCKGNCDRQMRATLRETGLIDKWQDIDDLMIPLIYIKWVMCVFNELRRGVVYTDEAMNKMKHFLLRLYPFVARSTTDAEKKRIEDLKGIPSYLGGLG